MALPRVVRTTILWMHLLTALVLGLVIMIMAATGITIAYERQIIEWANGYTVSPPASGADRAPIDSILAHATARVTVHATATARTARAPRPQATLQTTSQRASSQASPEKGSARRGERGPAAPMLTVSADKDQPAVVRIGREKTVYVNPYTAEVLGEGSAKARGFFSFIEGIHRWLGQAPRPGNADAPKRSVLTGKSITGAANLAFLFLLISGLFLWWPRRWTWNTVKPVVVPSTQLKGKARDFNWHNSLGFLAAPLLFVTIVTGTFMSFQWPGKLVNAWAGFPMVREGEGPPRGENAARGEAGAMRVAREEGGIQGERGERRGRLERSERDERSTRSTPAAPGNDFQPVNLNALWQRAQRQDPTWKTISFRVPTPRDKTVSFTIDRSAGTRPDQRGRLELDARTGAVVKWTAPGAATLFSSSYRQWMKPIHTGTAFGIVGQTIALFVALTTLVMVYTGFALSWRRFFAWRARLKRAKQESPVLAATVS